MQDALVFPNPPQGGFSAREMKCFVRSRNGAVDCIGGPCEFCLYNLDPCEAPSAQAAHSLQSLTSEGAAAACYLIGSGTS